MDAIKKRIIPMTTAARASERMLLCKGMGHTAVRSM
jgi:hypothetical protein